MARSLLRENMVVDSDFLSEAEHQNYPHKYRDLVDVTTYSGSPGLLLKSTSNGIDFDRWTTVSSTYYASTGQKLKLDSSSGPFVVVLPDNPGEDAWVSFIDSTYTCASNNVTISGNGNKIVNVDEPLVIDINGASFDLVYCNASVGWGHKK